VTFTRFLSENLHKFRSIGEKVAHGVRSAGNKVGGWLLSAAAPVAAFNSALGAGLATAGAVATGTAGIAGGVEGALSTRRVGASAVKGRADAVRAAYGLMRGQLRSQIDRGG
jgi:predicted phage tail protein